MNTSEWIVKELCEFILEKTPDRKGRYQVTMSKHYPDIDKLVNVFTLGGYRVTKLYKKYSVTIYVYPIGDK